MNAIMMYMSGNSLQIFSIMMVFMLFKGPIQGLINTSTVFAKFETEGTRAKLLGVKAVYILMQFGLLVVFTLALLGQVSLIGVDSMQKVMVHS